MLNSSQWSFSKSIMNILIVSIWADGWIRSLERVRYRGQFRACSTPTTYLVLPPSTKHYSCLLSAQSSLFWNVSTVLAVFTVFTVLTVFTVSTVLEAQISVFCRWCSRPLLTMFWNVHPSATYNALPAPAPHKNAIFWLYWSSPGYFQ